MSWDYAELSHIAKEFGGPERFVNAVNYDGIVQGRWQVIIPELVVVGLAGLGIWGKHLYDKRKVQNEITIVPSHIQSESVGTTEIETDMAVIESAEEPSPVEIEKAENIVERIRKRFKK